MTEPGTKCRAHVEEIKALRAKCKRLEAEQDLKALRKEIKTMHKRRQDYDVFYTRAVRTINELTEENQVLWRAWMADLTDDSLLTEAARRGFATYSKGRITL